MIQIFFPPSWTVGQINALYPQADLLLYRGWRQELGRNGQWWFSFYAEIQVTPEEDSFCE